MDQLPLIAPAERISDVPPGELSFGRGVEGAVIAESEATELPSDVETVDAPDKQAYTDHALRNLRNTSRTASGVIDTSASATKSEAIVEGLSSEAIADTATENFTQTIEQLYDMRDVAMESPEDLRELVEATALQINGGLLKEGHLIRSGDDSDKYGYTRLADLPEAMEEFYDSFFAALDSPDVDPIYLAGWVEYRIDLTDHFFADGCGKSAKAVSAWVLMRAGLPLPTYRGRDELYANAPTAIRQDGSEQTQKEQEAWLEYYRTLF
jgi:hypothetical protein